jgi:hypothetical protein
MVKSACVFLAMIILIRITDTKCQESLLPIYSDPMVFIDSLGHIVGTLPKGNKILNTKDGKHDSGFVRGLAGNSVPVNAMIPAKNFSTGKIAFYDKTGKLIMPYGDQFESISPNINGFHLAKKVDRRSMLPRTSYHFIDASGSRVFEYNGYYKADAFNEGFAAVNHRGWHYIDTLGKRHDLIDSTITNITEVSSFSNGLSKIKIRKGRYQSGDHYRYVFIDKKGDKVLDTEDVFPDDYIGRMGSMRDSISRVVFLDEKGYTNWGETAYVNMEGEVIGRFDSLFRVKEFTDGFVPILIQTKTKRGFENGQGFILDKNGERIGWGADKDVVELLHIDDQFYWVYLKDKKEGSNYSGVFDASAQEFVYRNKHDIMGMKWNLVSLRDSRSRRYYVVNYKTGEIVYDTDKSNQVFSNINEAIAHKEKVQKYICVNTEDVASLGELKNLKELTLRNIDIVEFPGNFRFSELEILKIDGLRNLEKLPDHIKNVKKLSLRNCTKSDNLMSMVTGLNGLEELFIINFDVTAEDKTKIIEMYPDAKVTIKGKKKYADSELQEVIFGF